MSQESIYFDFNASSPIRPEVLEAMLPFLKENYGNPSSLHIYGQKSRKAIEIAREKCARLINASDPTEIIFTSGATEANNAVIASAITMMEGQPKPVFASSNIEHSAIRLPLKHAETHGKIQVRWIPVDSLGQLKMEELKAVLELQPALVTVMSANNEIGTIQPTTEIAALCHAKGIPFHTDAVQSGGRLPVDVQKWGVDFLSVSGHKFGAPKGVGFLYCRKGTRFSPLVHGGHQEKNRRGGTENVASIVGMGVACEIGMKNQAVEAEQESKLRDQLETALLKDIPFSFVNGDKNHRTPNTTNMGFEFTDNSEMVISLDLQGVHCSSGSACASGAVEPSHVLTALGLSQEKAHACLRFSLGPTTTREQIEQAIPIITQTVAQLRENHPLWKEKQTQGKK